MKRTPCIHTHIKCDHHEELIGWLRKLDNAETQLGRCVNGRTMVRQRSVQ